MSWHFANHPRSTLSLLAGSALWVAVSCVGRGVGELPPSAWPGADLFAPGVIRKLRLELAPDAVASLHNNARKFVRATVVDGENTNTNVGLRLKGAVGSFRALEDKPGLTLDFSRFENGQKFHGLRRIHLNNSVEDPSYVNEVIGSEMFRATGLPAPRVTRALVELNGRPLGLYVLKEGFTEDFLACHFKQISGELYEPEGGHDVDERLKRNSVRAPVESRAALKALADAALEPDTGLRWQKLQVVLDLDRFCAFMSLEVMLGHRDGYSLARNNFRVYHDLDTGKMIFFPQGMDQLLGTPNLPWQPSLGGLVARAVMATPEGKQRYAACFNSIFTNAFKIETLTNRVDQLVRELRPVLSGDEWTGMHDASALVKERMVQRQLSVASQLNQPAMQPLSFVNGMAPLNGWRIAEWPLKGKMDMVSGPAGVPALHIAVAKETVASWRTSALLPQGRYRFEGRVGIARIEPLSYGVHHGAGLRIRGSPRRLEAFTGSSSARLITSEFQVDQTTEEVEFICELRARAGEAWFELNSLCVRRLSDL
jgi:spore coat protein H